MAAPVIKCNLHELSAPIDIPKMVKSFGKRSFILRNVGLF